MYRSDRGVFQTLKQVLKYSLEQRYKEQRNGRRALPYLQLPSSFWVSDLPIKARTSCRDELGKSGVRAKEPVPKPHQETPEPC